MDDDDRWDSVLRRDDGGGAFFYGVLTTGVYCRPSCPARRPRRENTRFFDTTDDAVAAGLRPCRRCRPDRPADRSEHADAVERTCRRIERSQRIPSLAELAAAESLGASTLRRAFTSTVGLSPAAYGRALRARRAEAALRDASTSVTESIHAAGYGSTSRFYETATSRLGMRPTELLGGGMEHTIRFAVAETSLGPLLVAATGRGVCGIEFGEHADALVRALQDRFPHAELVGGDEGFERLVAQVVGLVEHPRVPVDLPLDIVGTSFQERVWSALRTIPPGTTVTYAELAERIGSPSAVRAVGTACGANHLAVAVPCHRVVRGDGSVSGYRWGVERKVELLQREAAS